MRDLTDDEYDALDETTAKILNAKAEIKRANGKIWTGKAEWLDTPIKIEPFVPLGREEAHAR